MVFDRLRKLSTSMSSVASSDKEEMRNDTSYYLRRYRAEIKKFEEDRKRAIKDFEKNRMTRLRAILTRDSAVYEKNNNNKSPEPDIETGSTINLNASFNSTNDSGSSSKQPPSSSTSPSNKSRLYKEKLFDVCSSSTAHGIPNIARLDSRLIRVIWVLCFLASFSYCFYTIVNIVIVFLQYDVLINQEVVSEPPVDFPAVTVCNLNAFDRRNAQPYINQVLAKNNISYVSNINLIDIPPTQVNNLIKASIIGNKSFSRADIINMGFTIDYMLLTCYFNNVPCNQSDFRWVYDFDYTNCWQFNSGYDQDGNRVPIRQVNEAGSDRSLNLELFIGDDVTQSQYMLNSGARVVVHNQSVAPIISSEGLDIATGFKTNVAFRRSFFSRLDAPYSNCIKNTNSPESFNSPYYKAIFYSLNMTTYRQKVCLRICLQAFIKKSCSCIDGSLPNIYKNETDTVVCQTISLLDCVSKSRISYFSGQNSSTSDDCGPSQCPLECDTASFEMTTSSSRYPTSYYQSYLRARTNILSKFPAAVPPELTKTTVYLSVFYDDISTKYTEEIPAITGTTVLGTIGGNLGLFIGASLLTFVEIIELLIEFVFIAFNFRI